MGLLADVNLELHYGTHLIGLIEDAFWSDETGYGTFRSANLDEPSTRRIQELIAFSEEWHEQLRAERPCDPSEFDAYRDIYESDLWHTVASDGSTSRIRMPVFMQGEVTWRPSEK